ncbi:hypothetical protein [Kutzneria chonburiensis]|uniref:Uncharacterized protein n=1 Tax=Kutzneria chonburiensis TaxID=1483604 RepID=A0ABV6MPQ9_9PSEU|nr:hypothetical protein [Kutzneria chonburiensis]
MTDKGDAVRTVMSEDVWVHYGQFYVHSNDDWPGLGECFGGQRNGLCGGAVPVHLLLITGSHTGYVGLTVELHEHAPVLDETWEEIVEVSFRPLGDTHLLGWGGEWTSELALADVDHRVRYCGTRLDDGHEQDGRDEDEPELDRYLLQFWPSPPAPDEVVKQSSEYAAYWHGVARDQPAPPTPEERAEAERLARLEQERVAEEMRLRAEAHVWGGRLPDGPLRQMDGNARALATLDRRLADALAETGADTQRAVAHWAARRVYVEAQLADVEWIAPALAALDQGEPLPAPFDDRWRVSDLVLSDDRVPHTVVTSLDGSSDNFHQQSVALPAVFAAGNSDPLRAALEALFSAAHGFGRDRLPVLFAEARQAFPALARYGDRVETLDYPLLPEISPLGIVVPPGVD